MSSQPVGGSEEGGSPIPEDSNDFGRKKKGKADRSRRIWSVREEEILMATLKELTAKGWKADNGFRAGYLTRAREAIMREFPKTDILSHPHIYSKLTTWKKNYGSLINMLKLSGIGFSADYKIECDDEQWAQIVKVYRFGQKDTNAKYMRNKSWPQYEEWKEVFGKDRADGARKVDVGEAVGTIYEDKEPSNDASIDEADTSHPMTLEELFPDELFPDGVLPEMVDESQPVMEGGMPGASAAAGAGAGPVASTGAVAGAASGSGSGARAKMFDLSTKRTEVFDQLKGIPGLTLKQQFYISKKLVKEPELMDLFRGLSEAARAAFVIDILEIDEMLYTQDA